MSTEIMFQAFKWDAAHNGRHGDGYEFLDSKVSDLADAGFTYVWRRLGDMGADYNHAPPGGITSEYRPPLGRNEIVRFS